MDVSGPEVDDAQEALPAAEPADEEQLAAPRSRRPLVAGGLAGLWALLVGVAVVTCLVMLAWAVSPNSAGDSAAAWQAAGLTWLGLHLVPLQVSGQPVTLLPLGGVLLGLLLARRSGAWAGRLLPAPSVPEVVWLAVGAGALYGAGGAAIAWLTAGGATSAEPVAAGVVTGAVAALGALWGISGEAELVPRLRGRVSDAAWRTGVAALAVVVGLFAVGALLVTASLVRHFDDVAGTLADLDPGMLGAAAVTLVDALTLPNLAIWAVAVVVGPGFQLGTTGGLSAFGGEVTSLPALPVLAAIPTTAPGWAPLLLVVPVVLGVLAARIRWGRDLPTLTGTLVAAAALGGAVGLLTAAMLRLASGSLGSERLAEVGPVLLPAAAAAAGLVVLGFLAEAAFQSARLSWELHRAEQRAAAQRDDPIPEVIEVVVAVPADELEVPGDTAPADLLPEPAGRRRGPRPGVRGAAARVGDVGASAVSVVAGVGGAVATQVGAIGAAAMVRVGVMSHAGDVPAGDDAAGDAQAAAGAEGDELPADPDGPVAAHDGEVVDAEPEVVDQDTEAVHSASEVVDVRDTDVDLREDPDPEQADPGQEPAGAPGSAQPGALGPDSPDGTTTDDRVPGMSVEESPAGADPAMSLAEDDTDEIPVVVASAADAHADAGEA